MDKAVLKSKIKKVMLDHLTFKGYPNLTEEQILQELSPMWSKLLAHKLIMPGWTFGHFVAIARREAMRVQLQEELMKHFTRKP